VPSDNTPLGSAMSNGNNGYRFFAQRPEDSEIEPATRFL
jgi:hypothetical protein